MFFPNINKKSATPKIMHYTIDFFNKPIDYNSSEVEDINDKASVCYGFETSSGNLKTCYGFDVLRLPRLNGSHETRIVELPKTGDVKNVWFYRYYDAENNPLSDKVVFYSSDKKFYCFGCLVPNTSCTDFLNSSPDVIDECPTLGVNWLVDAVQSMVFSTPEGVLVASTPNMSMFYNGMPNFYDICKIYDLMFVILDNHRNAVYYTDDLRPHQWNPNFEENNAIDLTSARGRVTKLINFEDYLYVFHEYGISRITKYSSDDKFGVSQMFQASSRMYENTVVVAGSNMLFLTSDGIYEFNGSTAKRLDLGFYKLLQDVVNDKAYAVYSGGKYYLACRLNFDDGQNIDGEQTQGYENNALVVVDIQSKEYQITRGVDINTLTGINTGSLNCVLATFRNSEYSKEIGLISKTGKIFNDNITSLWQSKPLDLGYKAMLKRIKSITLTSKYDCMLKIESEYGVWQKNLVGKDIPQEIPVGFRGRNFTFTITSSGEAEITPPKLKFNVFD